MTACLPGFLALLAALGSGDAEPPLDSLDWAQAAWEGVETDQRVEVRELKVLGLDTAQTLFLLRYLPVRAGESLRESELAQRLDAFNRAAGRRMDLWQSVRAHSTGVDGSDRVVVVDASPYEVGTYYGGPAYAYLGNHNLAGTGGRRGTWIGYNLLGLEHDWNLVGRTHAGLRATRTFPLSPSRDEGRTVDWRVLGTFRWNPTLTWELGASVGPAWSQVDAVARREGRRSSLDAFLEPYWSFAPILGPWGDHEIDLRLEGSTGIRSGGSREEPVVHWSERASLRAEGPDPLHFAAFCRADWIASGPRTGIEPTTAFHRVAMLAAGVPEFASTLEPQARWQFLRRQFGFTRMDFGVLSFWEVACWHRTRGTDFDHAGGAGLYSSFTAPVGVDFQLQANLLEPRSLDLRFQAMTYM